MSHTPLTPPENFSNAQATQYTVTRTPMHDPGLIAVPALGPAGTPVIFVRVRAPQEWEVITWVASNDNGPPQVPSPYGPSCPFGLNDNRVLLSVRIGALVPNPIGTGSGHGWSLTGTYIYAKVQPEGADAAITLGKLPWESGVVGQNHFPAANFAQGILDLNYPDPLFTLPGHFQNPVPGP